MLITLAYLSICAAGADDAYHFRVVIFKAHGVRDQ
jgi:hypothetical protein